MGTSVGSDGTIRSLFAGRVVGALVGLAERSEDCAAAQAAIPSAQTIQNIHAGNFIISNLTNNHSTTVMPVGSSLLAHERS